MKQKQGTFLSLEDETAEPLVQMCVLCGKHKTHDINITTTQMPRYTDTFLTGS